MTEPRARPRSIVKFGLGETVFARVRERHASMPVYGYSHRREEGNLVGAVGEVVFERWLEAKGCPYEWLGSTRFDYRVGTAAATVEVKTKDRTIEPRRHFDVTVPAYNIDHQRPDWYVFVSLLRPRGTTDAFTHAFLVGAYPGAKYRDGARFWDAGVVDPDNGTRFWTSCWNRPMSDLVNLDVARAEWMEAGQGS